MADVVYLVTDLLFTSKIRETAGQLGLSAARAASPEALAEGAQGAAIAIVDLRLPGAIQALALLEAAGPGARRIGFVDHERADVMDAARGAGCHIVLAKGAFSKQLPELLSEARRG